jgi:hypothetical protein
MGAGLLIFPVSLDDSDGSSSREIQFIGFECSQSNGSALYASVGRLRKTERR